MSCWPLGEAEGLPPCLTKTLVGDKNQYSYRQVISLLPLRGQALPGPFSHSRFSTPPPGPVPSVGAPLLPTTWALLQQHECLLLRLLQEAAPYFRIPQSTRISARLPVVSSPLMCGRCRRRRCAPVASAMLSSAVTNLYISTYLLWLPLNNDMHQHS